jgi:hypothetical protein
MVLLSCDECSIVVEAPSRIRSPGFCPVCDERHPNGRGWSEVMD